MSSEENGRNVAVDAMLLASYALSFATVTKLYQLKKVTAREAEEIYDFALQTLEHADHQAGDLAPANAAARKMLDVAVLAARMAPDYDAG